MMKKHISGTALAAGLLLGSLSLTQMSCSQNQQKEVSQESDQAYSNFKSFVDETELKAQNAANETEADYERETTQLKADFDAKVAEVDKYANRYDDQRRQELEQLRTRYTTAYDARLNARNTAPAAAAATATAPAKAGKYYKSISTEIAVMTPQNARAKYTAFVTTVDRDKASYDIDDWRNINADWQAMDTRYDRIKGQISDADRRQIAEEKGKYAAFKSVDKTKLRAEQGADAVAGAAKDVGKGAKKVGQDVGRGAAKAGKAVGGAVKGVFNGKDKN